MWNEAGSFVYGYSTKLASWSGRAMGEVVTRGNLPHWYKPGFAHFITYRLAGTIPQARIRAWREDREAQLKRKPAVGVSLAEHRERAHKHFFAKYDDFLDKRACVAWLADPRIASIVRDNLFHHHGKLYKLISYGIMPNHVHVLLQPYESTVHEAASFVTPPPNPLGDSARVVPSNEHLTNEAGSFVYGVNEAASFVTSPGTRRPTANEGADFMYGDERPDSHSPLTRIVHSLKSYTATRANEILGRTGQFWQHESYDHWARDEDELARIVDYINVNPVRAGLCAAPHEWRFSSAYDCYLRDGTTCGIISPPQANWRRPRP